MFFVVRYLGSGKPVATGSVITSVYLLLSQTPKEHRGIIMNKIPVLKPGYILNLSNMKGGGGKFTCLEKSFTFLERFWVQDIRLSDENVRRIYICH